MVPPKPSPQVVYPESDDMGEHELQRYIIELLRPLLARLFAVRGVVAHVGADQFVYWREGRPEARLAPDVYVLPFVPQSIAIPSWKTWETGIRPSFAFEVASEDFGKDYDVNPALYDELGVDELVIFDPHARGGTRSRRVRWQVYRRLAGRLERVTVSQGERVGSELLGVSFWAVGEGDAVRVRISESCGLFPTAEEAAMTLAETERALAEKERAARLEAEAEVARLRAVLDAQKE